MQNVAEQRQGCKSVRRNESEIVLLKLVTQFLIINNKAMNTNQKDPGCCGSDSGCCGNITDMGCC